MAPEKTGRLTGSKQGVTGRVSGWPDGGAGSPLQSLRPTWEPRMLLKSPPLMAAVGTVSVKLLAPLRRRKPWYQPKKKVLSLRIGPPAVAPNSFCLFLGVVRA